MSRDRDREQRRRPAPEDAQGPSAASPAIRHAVRSDWDRIAELTVQAYVDGGFLEAGDEYIGHLADVPHRAAESQLLVAEVDGAVAASVAVTEAGSPMAEVARAGEIEFRMLAVAPEFQGRGIARSIVRHILSAAEQQEDVRAVTLCSLTTMTTAHALYRSEGFVEDPARDLYLEHIQKSFPFFIRHLRS